TKSLGKELARHGILVNCVTPAAVETDLFQQMTPAHIEYMLSRIPMGRFGQTTEIAALVAWLASEECSFRPTVSRGVICAVVCTYGCDDGRIALTRCAIIGRVLGAPYRACGTSTTPSFRRTRSPLHLCGNIMASVHG